MMWAGATLPDEWLECDGSAISRATYSGLFDILSTTYGAGDGVTTFNLPDFRSRMAMGYAPSLVSSSLSFDGASAVDPSTDLITVASNSITTGTPITFTGSNLPVAEDTYSDGFSLNSSGRLTGLTSGYLQNGDKVRIKSLSGTSAFTDEGIYYVINASGGSCDLSSTQGGSITGTGDAGTGTLSKMLSTNGVFYYIASSSTTFKVATSPATASSGTGMNITADSSGACSVTTSISAKALGQMGGEESHALTIEEMPAHTHTYSGAINDSGAGGGGSLEQEDGVTSSTGGSLAHNNLPPFTVVRFIIKT